MRRQGRGPSRREKRKAEQERPKPHSCEAQQTLTRVIRLLTDRAAGGHQTILIGQVLEMAVPGWKDPVHDDPRADPLFGTLPVTPEDGPGPRSASGGETAPSP